MATATCACQYPMLVTRLAKTIQARVFRRFLLIVDRLRHAYTAVLDDKTENIHPGSGTEADRHIFLGIHHLESELLDLAMDFGHVGGSPRDDNDFGCRKAFLDDS